MPIVRGLPILLACLETDMPRHGELWDATETRHCASCANRLRVSLFNLPSVDRGNYQPLCKHCLARLERSMATFRVETDGKKRVG